MLKQILEAKDTGNKIVVLQDVYSLPGVPLLRHTCQKWNVKGGRSIFCLLEPSSIKYLQPFGLCDKVEIIDWWQRNATIEESQKYSPAVVQDLLANVSSEMKGSGPAAVFIDSLSPLILHRGPAYTCQTLQRISRSADCVFALYHRDLHDVTDNAMLEHTATSLLRLQRPELQSHQYLCELVHRKVSGKVTRTRDHVTLHADGTLDVTTHHKLKTTATSGGNVSQDPAANLTFNLTLKDSEKDARSKLVLPYLRKKESTSVNPLKGQGEIYYQPDDADDWDEEDPDDDLDI